MEKLRSRAYYGNSLGSGGNTPSESHKTCSQGIYNQVRAINCAYVKENNNNNLNNTLIAEKRYHRAVLDYKVDCIGEVEKGEVITPG